MTSRFPLLLALCAGLLVGRTAIGAPEITVKGHTTVRIVGIYPGDDGAILVGKLLDRDLGTGIAERTVEVAVLHDGERRVYRARTDAEGEFRLTLPPGKQTYQVEARFAGDRTYAPDVPPPEALDITKLTPEIGLEMDRELDLKQASHELRISTRVEGRNIALPLDVSVEGRPRLARVETDINGHASLTLRAAQLGGPGPVTVVARFPGNGELNPTRAQHEALVISRVTLALNAELTVIQADDDLRLRGTIQDARGPIAGATIGLDAMGRHVASTLSEEGGRFHFEMRAEDFPPGPLDLVARFTPAVIWRHAATSPSVQVTIMPPTPIPAWLYLIPVAITTLIMFALLLVRFWPVMTRRKEEAADEGPVRPDPDPEPIESGVRLARSSLRSIVKPAFDLHGTVWNPVDRCPVPGARIAVQPDADRAPSIELSADDSGRFAIPGLPAGVHRVTVARAGFVGESFQVQIPHRGNLHGLRVDLVEVRVRLLEIYRDAAVPLLPKRQLWARWTPRELAHHVGGKAGQRDPDLDNLTRMLEHAYWSSVPADEALLERARALSQEYEDP